jgi:hypothetical protein
MSITIEANRESIVNAVREWSPAERAALIRDVAETLVEQPPLFMPEEPDPTQHTPEEIETVYQLRREWAENRRRRLAGEIELDHPRPNPYEGMTQEEALAQIKAEWEENRRRAHENYVPRPPSNILAEIYGIGNAEHPGPSDEEVEQWLHEHKMEKYG